MTKFTISLVIALACAARPAPPARASAASPTWDPDAVDAAARALPRLHSLLVSRRGEIVFEKSFNGARLDRPANIKSASKSIITALVGIAIQRGILPGIQTPILTYFPELQKVRTAGLES